MEHLTPETAATLARAFWPIIWALALLIVAGGLVFVYRLRLVKVQVGKNGATEIEVHTSQPVWTRTNRSAESRQSKRCADVRT